MREVIQQRLCLERPPDLVSVARHGSAMMVLVEMRCHICRNIEDRVSTLAGLSTRNFAGGDLQRCRWQLQR